MKFSSYLFLLCTAFAAANPLDRRAPPGCLADNCLRALTVTDSNLKASRPVMGSSYCSNFMTKTVIATVTPTESTSYETSTATASTTVTTSATATTVITDYALTVTYTYVYLDKRYTDSAIPAIPSFLSPCSSAARISSACSCIGITGATVTSTTTLPVSSTIVDTATTTSTTIFMTDLLLITSTSTVFTRTIVETVIVF